MQGLCVRWTRDGLSICNLQRLCGNSLPNALRRDGWQADGLIVWSPSPSPQPELYAVVSCHRLLSAQWAVLSRPSWPLNTFTHRPRLWREQSPYSSDRIQPSSRVSPPRKPHVRPLQGIRVPRLRSWTRLPTPDATATLHCSHGCRGHTWLSLRWGLGLLSPTFEPPSPSSALGNQHVSVGRMCKWMDLRATVLRKETPMSKILTNESVRAFCLDLNLGTCSLHQHLR